MACNSPNCGQCSGCLSACNACQGGCQTCQTCNKCQICDKCMSSCDAGGQASYDGRTISSIFGQFSFTITPVANETQMGPYPGMFNKNIWDEISTWISQRHKLPIGYNGEENYTVQHANSDGGSIVAKSALEAVNPFSASEFNRIANSVGASTVSSGDLITASLFTSLVTSANTKTVDNGACQYCVSVCDLTYNQCQTCNVSQCATYCQSCNSTCNNCNACNSGECCNGCMGACETCNVCNTTCNSGQDSGGGSSTQEPK